MTNKRIETWKLERYLLGELPSSSLEEISRLVQENPELQKEIQNLRQAQSELLRQNPPETMLPGIRKRYEELRGRAKVGEKARPVALRRLLYGTPVLASALLLVFVVLLKDRTGPGSTRIKGEESLDFSKTQILIYKKSDDEIKLLSNGGQARAGDLLQLAYVPAGKTHGVIISVDGNGIVTLHLPESKNGATLLGQETKNPLSSAYQLDDAPDFERFFFITAMTEIDVSSVLNEAEGLALSPGSAKFANLELPNSYDQFSVLINKEKRNE
jgi:hypothetical protein